MFSKLVLDIILLNSQLELVDKSVNILRENNPAH
jgi:hypothetical protein